jgi:hypothetical protein
MIDLIITRFNEDVSWSDTLLPRLNKRYVYDKSHASISINDNKTVIYNKENLGRESLTIFEHIYDNYDSLPDIIVFLQGTLNDKPDHPTLPLEEYLGCSKKQIIGCLRNKDQTYEWKGNGNNKSNMTLIDWQKHLNICNRKQIYIRCNNFAIGRDVIHSFPKEYYKNLVDNAHLKAVNPFSAYFVELSNIDIFVGQKSYKLIMFNHHQTKNRNDLQHVKGLEI